MVEEAGNQEDQFEEYDVVELEAEDGERDEFVVFEKIPIKGTTYAVMASMEDVENMENMSEDEFRDYYGDDPFFIVMREDGESFYELQDEEYASIESELKSKMAAGNSD